jgi:hypothetical protein
MKIITNEPLIRRNTKIAQYTGLAGLLVLLGGMYFLFAQPEQFGIIWTMVLLGFFFSQIGIYFTNRWGRRPRPDEVLNQSLKGLDHNYTLYHYQRKSPTRHLLVGPAGVFALLPHYQRGKITYEKGRWRQKGGGVGLAYLKFFGQEGIGRVDLEVSAEVDAVTRFLEKNLPEGEAPTVQPLLIFTNDKAELVDMEEAPVPTLQPRKVKEHIRKQIKGKALSADKIRQIKELVEGVPDQAVEEVAEADE